jgi:hypothetical protein
MHQIYGNLDGVLVWVGEGDEDSDLALYFIAGANGFHSTDMYVGLEDGEAAVFRSSNTLRACGKTTEPKGARFGTQSFQFVSCHGRRRIPGGCCSRFKSPTH